jgi:hypothetical protein
MMPQMPPTSGYVSASPNPVVLKPPAQLNLTFNPQTETWNETYYPGLNFYCYEPDPINSNLIQSTLQSIDQSCVACNLDLISDYATECEKYLNGALTKKPVLYNLWNFEYFIVPSDPNASGYDKAHAGYLYVTAPTKSGPPAGTPCPDRPAANLTTRVWGVYRGFMTFGRRRFQTWTAFNGNTVPPYALFMVTADLPETIAPGTNPSTWQPIPGRYQCLPLPFAPAGCYAFIGTEDPVPTPA